MPVKMNFPELSYFLDHPELATEEARRHTIAKGLAANVALTELIRSHCEVTDGPFDSLENLAPEVLSRMYMDLVMVALDMNQGFIALAMENGTPVDAASVMSAAATAKALARWKDSPSQTVKREVREDWNHWQLNRGLYKYPRDFRLAMQRKHPALIDGTLKNWMSAWGREDKS